MIKRHVGERRRLGVGGRGSLFPSGLVGSEPNASVSPNKAAKPGQNSEGSGPLLAEEQEWADQ